jgi:hypothetical protein
MAVTADQDFQGSYGPEWARAANTTLIESFKDVPELMLRSTPVLAMIQHRGNVETNVSGRGWQRAVQYRLTPEQPSTGTSPRSFAPTNKWKRITLERRYIDITDSITKPERNANEGDNAIVPVFKGMVKRLRKDAMQHMAKHVYKDGDAAGETGWHGFNSFTGVSLNTASQSIDQTSAGAPSASGYVSRDVNVADPFMLPNDTYCGLSTALGNYGGRQLSGIWPDGECNEWMDFNSPLLVNSNTTFRGPIGSGQTGWQTNAVELLSLGCSMANRNMLSSPLDLVVMKQMQFDELKNALRTKERVHVTSSASVLRSYGFANAHAIEVDGMEIALDYFAANVDTVRTDGATATSVPAIYGFCTGCWHVASAYDGLWDFDPAFYDIDTKATKFAGDADGNFWNESVRGSVLWAPFSATS